MNRSRLMTFEETRIYLNIKTSRLRTMIFKKEIPYIKLGRLIRFDEYDVNEWIRGLKNVQGKK